MEVPAGADDETATLVWLMCALERAREGGHERLVGYLEAVADEVVFEAEAAARGALTAKACTVSVESLYAAGVRVVRPRARPCGLLFAGAPFRVSLGPGCSAVAVLGRMRAPGGGSRRAGIRFT